MKRELKVKIDSTSLISLERFSNETGIEIGLIIDSLIYNAYSLPTDKDIQRAQETSPSTAEILLKTRNNILRAIINDEDQERR